MGLLHQALSKIPYSVGRWEMSAKTWNNLKTRVMAVHGPNIDWWGVRISVNRYLTARRTPNESAVEAFNTMYELTPFLTAITTRTARLKAEKSFNTPSLFSCCCLSFSSVTLFSSSASCS
jgi:hypothetical protein